MNNILSLMGQDGGLEIFYQCNVPNRTKKAKKDNGRLKIKTKYEFIYKK
jgi:hypothetical protein